MDTPYYVEPVIGSKVSYHIKRGGCDTLCVTSDSSAAYELVDMLNQKEREKKHAAEHSAAAER
jgi:hypothetical protein